MRRGQKGYRSAGVVARYTEVVEYLTGWETLASHSLKRLWRSFQRRNLIVNRLQLQLADGQWFFFDKALKNMQASGATTKPLSDVFVTSENLLSVMDRVTGLYAAIAT